MSLEEGLCSEGKLTVGAQEDWRCCSCIIFCKLEKKERNNKLTRFKKKNWINDEVMVKYVIKTNYKYPFFL